MPNAILMGNWKLTGNRDENTSRLSALVSGYDSQFCAGVELVVCCPYPYLGLAKELLAGSKIALAAQDVSQYERGAYTGEVSAAMLADFNVKYALVGHSERRTLMGEADSVMAAKCAHLWQHGITPVLCVGETLQQRERGETADIVRAQCRAALPTIEGSLIVAYEPVWAIGTGLTASTDDIVSVHQCLRQELEDISPETAGLIPILYGGSVNQGNVALLLGLANVRGALVGGASWQADSFLEVIKSCSIS